MKVILLKDIAKVGKKYEHKEVADGFALNSLIPRGLALAATPDAVKRIELEKSRIIGEKKIHDDLLLKNLAQIDGKTITLELKANEKGHLFAGINSTEILPALKTQLNADFSAENITLPKPIKEVGEHVIKVQAAGKAGAFTLVIKAL